MKNNIKVYSTPNCVQCTATYKALDALNVAYDVIDLSVDTDAMSFVKSLNHQQAPIVVIGDVHWSGFRPDKIKDIINFHEKDV